LNPLLPIVIGIVAGLGLILLYWTCKKGEEKRQEVLRGYGLVKPLPVVRVRLTKRGRR